MKPAPFEYHAPSSLDAALQLKAQHGDEAKFLAGGQSLIPAMNFRVLQPSVLIDLNRLAELDFVRAVDGELRLGAMTRQRTVERSAVVKEWSPLIHETMPYIAHPQIRNRGTIGGNLAHADPASELPVLMLALGARLRVQSSAGDRWVHAADFFRGLFTTDLASEEMLVEIALPQRAPNSAAAFTEVSRRHGDYAMMGVAAVVTTDEGGICREARLVYLNAGDGPVNATQAAAQLIGQILTESAIEAAAVTAADNDISPFGNVHASPEYQRHLARVLTKRILRQVSERLGSKL